MNPNPEGVNVSGVQSPALGSDVLAKPKSWAASRNSPRRWWNWSKVLVSVARVSTSVLINFKIIIYIQNTLFLNITI